jgi:hypothetical protein
MFKSWEQLVAAATEKRRELEARGLALRAVVRRVVGDSGLADQARPTRASVPIRLFIGKPGQFKRAAVGNGW